MADFDLDPPWNVADAYDRFTAPAERWGAIEVEPERELEWKRGEPTPPDLIEDYCKRGGRIDRGEERAAKQKINDQRHEARKKRHPLMDVVVEIVATWNSSGYLGKHRAIVRQILARPSNQRRRKLSAMSTMQRRHQEAIRLLHALAFQDISQAEYCRRHHLDPADACRMLDHLYEKEPRLADAIGAISACVAATSWQNRQQQKILRNKERKVRVIYGYDYADVIDNGWLADYDAGSTRSIYSGRFKPCALVRDTTAAPGQEDTPPLDLHEPGSWYSSEYLTLPHRERLPLHYWGALYDPICAAQRYEPLLDRYRSISRTVQLKNGARKVWRISRALDRARPAYDPVLDDIRAMWLLWASQAKVLEPPVLAPEPPHGVFHRRFRPNVPVHVALEVRGDVVFIHHGYPIEDCGGVAPASIKISFEAIEDRLSTSKWSKGPMCNAVRNAPLPLSWTGPHRFVQPYTRRDWLSWPVKEYEVLLPKQFGDGTRLYFVRRVTPA